MFTVRYRNWERGGELTAVFETKSGANLSVAALRRMGFHAHIEEGAALTFGGDNVEPYSFFAEGDDYAESDRLY